MGVEEKNKRSLLLEEARHEEILSALKGLSSAIGNTPKNDVVAKAIEGNTKEIGNFGKKLGELQIKVEAPNVNVNNDHKPVIDALKELKDQGARIENLLIEQNKFFAEMCKPKDYEFHYTRNQWGVMNSPIVAKTKQNIKN
jgi:hypothetical protein